jgi:hypothetical protein
MRDYPHGLASLRHDRIAKSHGLSEKWMQRLLENPISRQAGVAQWREHFLSLKREHEKERTSEAES